MAQCTKRSARELWLVMEGQTRLALGTNGAEGAQALPRRRLALLLVTVPERKVAHEARPLE